MYKTTAPLWLIDSFLNQSESHLHLVLLSQQFICMNLEDHVSRKQGGSVKSIYSVTTRVG